MNPRPKPPMPGGESTQFIDGGPQPVSPNATRVKLIPVGDGGPCSLTLMDEDTGIPCEHTSDVERAWAAGFFEGEGSITVTKDYTLHARVPQIDYEPLNILKQLFGGTIRNKCASGNRKPCREWNIVNDSVLDFLAAIEGFVSRDRVRKRIAMARTLQAIKKDRSLQFEMKQTLLRELFDDFKRSNAAGLPSSTPEQP